MANIATAKVLIENDQVIVTEYHFKPGDHTEWHRHMHDYVVVPMADGKLRIAHAQGETLVDMVKGSAYYRTSGVEHDVINAGSHDYTFIEIEIKKTRADLI